MIYLQVSQKYSAQLNERDAEKKSELRWALRLAASGLKSWQHELSHSVLIKSRTSTAAVVISTVLWAYTVDVATLKKAEASAGNLLQALLP